MTCFQRIPEETVKKFPTALFRLGRSSYGLVMLGLVVLLVVGLVTLTDYGTSMDEPAEAEIGRLFLEAYDTGHLQSSPTIGPFHGPFYFMVFTLTSQFLRGLNPRWLPTDGVHLTNFLMFLVGLFFYRIALRLFPRGVALFVTALFATQPVIFGHAFINQKDTPLMALFVMCVELGWMAVDERRPADSPELGEEKRPVGFRQRWRRRSKENRILIVSGTMLGLVMLADVWWLGGLRGVARSLLEATYAGRGPAFLVEAFGRVAEDAYKTPLSAYLAKLDGFFSQGRTLVSLLIVAGGLALWDFPAMTRGWLGLQQETRSAKLHWPALLAAGFALGVTVSTRVVALFAGILVAGHWMARIGRRSVPALVVYAVFALVTTYLTWPALWGDPLLPFTQAGSGLDRFGRHAVLFWGSLQSSGDLPWHYTPTLMAVQLTLPAILLFLLGAPYSWHLTTKDEDRRLIVVLIWVWLAAPIAAAVLGWVPIYNNFRHLLFGLPPAFLIMGFGVLKLLSFARSAVLRGALVLVALGPGIVGIVQLHPYEYIYYNEIVGGVRGAEGDFDLDYWCTALREAMVEVNRVAKPGVRVLDAGARTAEPFVRPDLLLIRRPGAGAEPAFALACGRDVTAPAFLRDMEAIYEVRSGGALLAVVGAASPDR